MYKSFFTKQWDYLKQEYLSTIAPGFIFNLIASLAFLAIVLFIYRASFISSFLFLIDDRIYIILNPFIQEISLHNIEHIFTHTFCAKWAPFHILAYMILYHFFGLNAPAFHIANAVLFVSNGFLLYRIVYAMLGDKYAGLLAGLLYLIAPIQVESVMWAAELKTTLSITFIFGSFLSYIRYRKGERRSDLLISLFFWAMALMSKAIAFTLPVMFLLYDVLFYPDKVRKKYLLYLIPIAIGMLFAVSYLLILNDVSSQTPLMQHLKTAIINTAGLFSYPLGQIFPFLVMPYYNTLPVFPWLSLPVIISIVFLGLIAYVLWRYHRTVPYITFWLMWYGINFLPGSGIGNVPMPFMGFIPQGYNHYLPLPFAGIAVVGGFVLIRLFAMLRTYAAKSAYILSVGLILATMSMTSAHGASWFTDNSNLLKALHKNYSNDPVVTAMQINSDFKSGKKASALRHLSEMEKQFPDNPLTHYYKGVSLLLKNDKREAEREFNMMVHAIGTYTITSHLDAFLFVELLNNTPYSQRDMDKLSLSTAMTENSKEFYPHLLCHGTIQGLIADKIWNKDMDIKFAAQDYLPYIAYGCAYLQQPGKKENACDAFYNALLKERFFMTNPKTYHSMLLKETIRALQCEVPVPVQTELILLGAVRHPGDIAPDPGFMLRDAIIFAGGPLPVADLRNILILRQDKIIRVNFIRYIQTGDIADNPLLKDSDIVYIPKIDEQITVSGIQDRARKYLEKDDE